MAGVDLVAGWNYVTYMGDTLPCSQAIPTEVIDSMVAESRGIFFWDEQAQAWKAWIADVPSTWQQDLMTLVHGETYSLQMAVPARWEFVGGGSGGGFPWAMVGVGIGLLGLIAVSARRR